MDFINLSTLVTGSMRWVPRPAVSGSCFGVESRIQEALDALSERDRPNIAAAVRTVGFGRVEMDVYRGPWRTGNFAKIRSSLSVTI